MKGPPVEYPNFVSLSIPTLLTPHTLSLSTTSDGGVSYELSKITKSKKSECQVGRRGVMERDLLCSLKCVFGTTRFEMPLVSK